VVPRQRSHPSRDGERHLRRFEMAIHDLHPVWSWARQSYLCGTVGDSMLITPKAVDKLPTAFALVPQATADAVAVAPPPVNAPPPVALPTEVLENVGSVTD